MASVRKSLAMGPSVRNLLSQYQLDPKRITCSGPHNTLLKSDVLGYIKTQQNDQSTTTTTTPTTTARQTVWDGPIPSKRYARKYPSEMEIDVINSGGLVN